MKKIGTTFVAVLLVGSISMTAHAETKQQNSQNDRYSVFSANTGVNLETWGNPWKDVRVSLEDARKLAQNVQPGIIREVELEKESGALYYKVEIKTDRREVDVYVDAMTGEAWRENDPARLKQMVKISAEEAKKIALARVKGTIVKLKLDEDDGRFVYEVEVRTDKWQEVDIEISATTGAVLDVEFDD